MVLNQWQSLRHQPINLKPRILQRYVVDGVHGLNGQAVVQVVATADWLRGSVSATVQLLNMEVPLAKANPPNLGVVLDHRVVS